MEKENVIYIPDDFKGYKLDSFFIPKQIESYLDSVIIPKGLIDDRIEKIAYNIAQDYNDEPFVALCVLKGGYQYFNSLLAKVKQFYQFMSFDGKNNYSTQKITIEFIRVKSYEDDQSSNLKVIGIENLENLRGKNVLIVEDIIDTGKTMKKLLKLLESYDLKSLKVTSLVVKRKEEGKIHFLPNYVGFDVPDHFIVGHNFDFNEHFRDLNHVCIINDNGKKHFSIKK